MFGNLDQLPRLGDLQWTQNPQSLALVLPKKLVLSLSSAFFSVCSHCVTSTGQIQSNHHQSDLRNRSSAFIAFFGWVCCLRWFYAFMRDHLKNLLLLFTKSIDVALCNRVTCPTIVLFNHHKICTTIGEKSCRCPSETMTNKFVSIVQVQILTNFWSMEENLFFPIGRWVHFSFW